MPYRNQEDRRVNQESATLKTQNFVARHKKRQPHGKHPSQQVNGTHLSMGVGNN